MIRTPGSHAPNIKNRSSKQNFKLTKHKPVVRSWSREMLNKHLGDVEVQKEVSRRNRKNEKKNAKNNK